MRILVVCGAGASSTFVAHRVRQAAQARGLDYSAHASTEASLAIDVDSADVVLVGPHLAASIDEIERTVAAHGALAVLLPDDVFADVTGELTLDLVHERLVTRAPAEYPPRKEDPMAEISRTVRIGSSHGLHARPAKLFAQEAKGAGIPVTIAKDSGKPVNAASILGVISLGIEHGDYVTLTADGDNAEATLDALAELLTTDHDAEG